MDLESLLLRNACGLNVRLGDARQMQGVRKKGGGRRRPPTSTIKKTALCCFRDRGTLHIWPMRESKFNPTFKLKTVGPGFADTDFRNTRTQVEELRAIHEWTKRRHGVREFSAIHELSCWGMRAQFTYVTTLYWPDAWPDAPIRNGPTRHATFCVQQVTASLQRCFKRTMYAS